MRVRLVGVLIMVIVLVAAACGDDGGSGATTTAPPGVTGTTTGTTIVPASPPTTSPQSSAPPSTVAATTVPPTTVPLVPLDELDVEFVEVASGFSQPVFVTAAPGDTRLFVVDQPGVVWAVDGGERERFLDINEQVAFRGERGLLGLAFHPDYAENGRFFVNYTNNDGDTIVAELAASGGVADVGSQRVVLRIDQPAGNHNGGMIAFGPDGYLWIGMGDGGGSDDRYGHGQRPDTLLAAMLRIDVDGAQPYAIPADNPFADGSGGGPEVWAYGLRNPWRWSFDGDRIFIADVGQNAWEEVSVAASGDAGLNYGWPVMEATRCFQRSGCDQTGLVLPVIEYGHGDGCSVTGGYVYRGSALPELVGHYFYGDYCGGWVNSAVIDDAGRLVESRQWAGRGVLPGLTSFGVDAAGELYATTTNGSVWRLERG